MSGDSWASFDCYGTLVDWVGGMTAAVAPHAGTELPRIMQAYYEAELQVQARAPTMRYRDVLAEATRQAFDRCAVALAPGGQHAMAENWAAMPVFDDVRDALGRLRADGWRIAILTNCDDDLIELSVARIGVEIDRVVTAEQVGSYKPAHGHFIRFDELTANRRAHWVHCANSFVHDMVPASELGIPRVWIDRDRSGEDPAIASAHLDGMQALPAVLEALRIS